jgi:hypothetical protein
VGRKASAAFGWTDVPRELRVRTAIDVTTQRAAEEQLFAYQMIVPDGHEWIAYLDLHEVPAAARDAVFAELHQLLSAGLGPLGKTKMHADVSIEPASAVKAKWTSDSEPLPGRRWVVTLQTPTVLCASDDLRDPTGEGLRQGYDRTWQELSHGALSLGSFFARQSLAAPRFAGRLPTNGAGQYYPFVLTDAGSTFVLTATGDLSVAHARIGEWMLRGVPVREGLLGGSENDPDWRRCPYLNRHGYGEIAVNQPWLVGHGSGDMPMALADERS